MSYKIAVLPGDGIGPEVMREGIEVLQQVAKIYNFGVELEEGIVGGASIDAHGKPLTDAVLNLAKQSDAVMLGAMGGPKWDGLDYSIRPERALLGLRQELGLFANLRPVKLFSALASASTLKREVVEGTDLLVVRELTGGIYFGQPKGVTQLPDGTERGVNTEVYTTPEIERIAHVAFQAALKRRKKVTSVDKANVLEVTELWRKVVTRIHKDEGYAGVTLEHILVDNCAMQLIRNPKQFDVLVTTNMFGDILSDEAAMLTGSIGMLPSASLDANNKGMYDPSHGSAPDIAGKDIANPLATILSAAMMLRYTFNDEANALRIENAVKKALAEGRSWLRTLKADNQINAAILRNAKALTFYSSLPGEDGRPRKFTLAASSPRPLVTDMDGLLSFTLVTQQSQWGPQSVNDLYGKLAALGPLLSIQEWSGIKHLVRVRDLFQTLFPSWLPRGQLHADHELLQMRNKLGPKAMYLNNREKVLQAIQLGRTAMIHAQSRRNFEKAL